MSPDQAIEIALPYFKDIFGYKNPNILGVYGYKGNIVVFAQEEGVDYLSDDFVLDSYIAMNEQTGERVGYQIGADPEFYEQRADLLNPDNNLASVTEE